MDNIEWRAVVGFEGKYEVSNTGIVKSLGDPTTRRKKKEKIRKTSIDKGYERISLRKGNLYYKYGVHRLVAKAFIPNPQGFLAVNHLDGNKLNNNVKNLEWCTQKENIAHSYRTGLSVFLQSEKVHTRKLERHQVDSIREIYNRKEMKQKELANHFNVDESTISNIITYKTWK